MNKFDKVLEKVKAVVEEIDGKDREVVKTVKMKPEWMKLHQEAEGLADQACEFKRKAMSVKDEMWAKIQRDMDDYNTDKHISDDGKSLQVYKD